MVFQHSGARDFDLGGGFHYSGSYPMVFQHSGSMSRGVELHLPCRARGRSQRPGGPPEGRSAPVGEPGGDEPPGPAAVGARGAGQTT